MKIRDKVAIITGGGSGIGEGLAQRFAQDGARHVVVADLNEADAMRVAQDVGGTGVGLDVGDEAAIRALTRETEEAHGAVDLFVSNAGFVIRGGVETSNADMQNNWDVHVLSHLYAARAALPGMIARGGGYLLNTASAAGLLTQLDSLSYSVTKHAAVGLAEWLAIAHHHQGIRVSVLCPQAVATNIGANSPVPTDARVTSPRAAAADGVLRVEDVNDCVIDALDQERFWVLPHPEVAEYARRKGTDVDRWLSGMRRFQDRLWEGQVPPGDWLLPEDA